MTKPMTTTKSSMETPMTSDNFEGAYQKGRTDEAKTYARAQRHDRTEYYGYGYRDALHEVLEIINEKPELSITDLELYRHTHEESELAVLDKVRLLVAINQLGVNV